MYGDKSGREPWRRLERFGRRLATPLDAVRLRRAGFRREGRRLKALLDAAALVNALGFQADTSCCSAEQKAC